MRPQLRPPGGPKFQNNNVLHGGGQLSKRRPHVNRQASGQHIQQSAKQLSGGHLHNVDDKGRLVNENRVSHGQLGEKQHTEGRLRNNKGHLDDSRRVHGINEEHLNLQRQINVNQLFFNLPLRTELTQVNFSH